MPLLASDIMSGARVFLNDNAASLYTNALITPHVAGANKVLETELLSYGVEVQRVQSAVIPVSANALVLNLPSDFLLPIELYERASGNSSDPWAYITPKPWNPADYTPTTTLTYWAFYNNTINFPGATVARDVMLRYDRQLLAITGPNSPEDFALAQEYLTAKTAELCARYVGMNSQLADEIATREFIPAQNKLSTILVLEMQKNPQRRIRFTTQRRNVGIR